MLERLGDILLGIGAVLTGIAAINDSFNPKKKKNNPSKGNTPQNLRGCFPYTLALHQS